VTGQAGATVEGLVFRVQHGTATTEYTDWAIARREAINQLQQQWIDSHGPTLNGTDSQRRTLTCEHIVWACTNGDYRGLENVPLTICTVAAELVSAERLASAQRSTLEARGRLDGVTLLHLPSVNTPLPTAAAA
jgi:hypothetical protein